MKSPAFQFYAAEFLADENVVLMTNQEVGCYIKLMAYCWREGSIPSDVSKIARLCGEDSSAMAQLWLAISSCFAQSLADEGRLVHARLEKERLKQEEHRKERAESGKRGAESRWKTKNDSKSLESANCSANGSAIKESMANDGSSSSTSSSSSKYKKTLSPEGDGVSVLIPYDKIFDAYEKVLCVHPYDRPTVKLRDDKRKAAIKRIVKARPNAVNHEWWETYFRAASENEHWMKGDKQKGGTWGGANFDFLLRDDVFKRILEGAA